MNPGEPRRGVLLRLGEVFLKGQNRGLYLRRLEDNLRRAVLPEGGSIERLHHRFLALPRDTQGDLPPERAALRLVAALQRVFGLTSMSPAFVVEKDYAAIERAAHLLFDAAVHKQRPRSFKVECRRPDKRFPIASPELGRRLGAHLHAAFGVPVDLERPDLEVGVEVGYEHAFVFAGSLPAPGGLPVGSTGRVDLLLSGGIDSPVAGWLAMKRGCHLAATYFHSPPYTGDKTRDKVRRLARKLAAWQGEVALRVVHFTDAQRALRAAASPEDHAVVLYRRMMLRVAEAIARQRGAKALVTGESLGQVASQTLTNMAIIEQAASLPILRPLVAHDKQETIAVAERLGTYELSIEPYDDCCSLWLPEHPTTRAHSDRVRESEERVDMPALVEACLARVETLRCEP